MAALSYNFLLTDGGNNGSGPYTLTVISNPTTPASGGTAITANIPTNTLGTFNPIELLSYAQELMLNNIAGLVEQDSNN